MIIIECRISVELRPTIRSFPQVEPCTCFEGDASLAEGTLTRVLFDQEKSVLRVQKVELMEIGM